MRLEKCDNSKLNIPVFIIILSMLMLCLSGCNGSNGSSGSDHPDISHFVALTRTSEDRPDIYLIIKVMDSSYWNIIVNGVRAAGEDLDCNIYYGGTHNETDWRGQRTLIDEAVSGGADAVILAPNDSVELSSDIDTLHGLGIPVALIDTAANTESFDICYMTDNLFAGQNAAKEMLSRLHSSGYSDHDNVSVGIMVGSATSQTINERLAGFYQYWTNNAPGKWSIVSDIMNCNGDVDEGIRLCSGFITAHPEVRGLYGTNNTPTKALCRVIIDNKRTDLNVVGFDYSEEMRTLVEAADYNASTILQRQYSMGYHSVDSVLHILDGDPPNVKFIDTGVVTVNRDTMSDPEVKEVLDLN